MKNNKTKIVVHNPYYKNIDPLKRLMKGKDPMKELFWNKHNADVTKGFVRNPFAPRAEYGYDFTTYEKWQQSGFVQPEVDAWIQ